MNERLVHRGPDGSGVYQGEGISLGSTRLKIIDLIQGDMPFHSPCGRYHLVYNGEIYNYKELRAEVSEYPFTSSSDTEVLFALLQKHGEAAIAKLNGMFTFAFYDEEQKRLLVARDRLGIKPLFYTEQGNRLALSSEINPLLLLPGLDASIDRQALHHYLSLLCVPEPFTIYKGIRRFPAGHYAWVEGGRLMPPQSYWQLRFDPKVEERGEELEHKIHDLFRDSVYKRLVADVPVGVFLSGGIDSTVVAGVARAGSTEKLRSFCLGFAGGLDERETAAATASVFGATHMDFLLQADELWQDIPSIISHFAEPFAGGLPMWFLSREIAKHVTVALSGTGGDELFGNYGRSRHLRPELGLLRGLKSALRVGGVRGLRDCFGKQREYILKHGAHAGHLYHEKCYAIKEYEKKSLLCELAPERSDMLLNESFWHGDLDSLEDRLFQMDLSHQLRDEFLYSQDILSMAHHLEVRVPFLDHRLVELMAQVPPSIRSSEQDPKFWMRQIFKNELPMHVLQQEKKGFMIPYGQWLRSHLRPMAEELLSPQKLDSQGIFRSGLVFTWWQRHQAGEDLSYRLWPIFIFQLWLEQRN